MLLRLILEHAATRGHGVSFAAVRAYRGLRAAIFVVPLRITRRRQSNFFRQRRPRDRSPAPREGPTAAAAALERC